MSDAISVIKHLFGKGEREAIRSIFSTSKLQNNKRDIGAVSCRYFLKRNEKPRMTVLLESELRGIRDLLVHEEIFEEKPNIKHNGAS